LRSIPAKLAVTAIVAVLAACSSSMKIKRTFEDPGHVDRYYQNILVIGVAADYNARSRFERALAAALESPTTRATEYYEIAGGDQVLSREKILAAIEKYGYDGVVVTQLGNQQSEVSVKTGYSQAKVSRRSGNAVDLFRYDYEILNEPHRINIEMQVVLISDFFDAADAKRIWTAESTVSDKENIAYLLEDTAAMIARRLDQDGIVAN
jgi:uncharacterized Fe-S cluster-containing radical SAM superfamily protein